MAKGDFQEEERAGRKAPSYRDQVSFEELTGVQITKESDKKRDQKFLSRRAWPCKIMISILQIKK